MKSPQPESELCIYYQSGQLTLNKILWQLNLQSNPSGLSLGYISTAEKSYQFYDNYILNKIHLAWALVIYLLG